MYSNMCMCMYKFVTLNYIYIEYRERKQTLLPNICQQCPTPPQKKNNITFSSILPSCKLAQAMFTVAAFVPLAAILQYPWSSSNASGPTDGRGDLLDVTASVALKDGWISVKMTSPTNMEHEEIEDFRRWFLCIFQKENAFWWRLTWTSILSCFVVKKSPRPTSVSGGVTALHRAFFRCTQWCEDVNLK